MMYWDTFRDNQSLCKVFSPKSIFDLISVKLCLFLFTLSLDFTLNAIFYSDDIVSERYHNEGSLSFFSEVLKSLYSAAIGFILSSFIISFSSYNSVLELIVKEYKYQQGYLSLCAMCLKKVRKRILFFFLLQFLVMFFLLYYVTIFCIVYNGSQWSWFKGGWISFLLSFITTLSMCLLIAILRFCSLKNKSVYAYNTSIFVNRIL